MSNTPSLPDRLRMETDRPDSTINQAADMLEFLLNQFHIASCKMDGRHSWRFAHGWPMTHCVGRTPEEAVREAMTEVDRSKETHSGDFT